MISIPPNETEYVMTKEEGSSGTSDSFAKLEVRKLMSIKREIHRWEYQSRFEDSTFVEGVCWPVYVSYVLKGKNQRLR